MSETYAPSYKCWRCKDTDIEHGEFIDPRNPKGKPVFMGRRCPDCKTRRDHEIRNKFNAEQDNLRRQIEHEERAALGQASAMPQLEDL